VSHTVRGHTSFMFISMIGSDVAFAYLLAEFTKDFMDVHISVGIIFRDQGCHEIFVDDLSPDVGVGSPAY
jgi:hypothetical protein